MLTVKALLSEPFLAGAKVVAGAPFLNLPVTSASLLEVPDFNSENHSQELLFTTGFPFKDDPLVQERLIKNFGEFKVSGLVMKVHRYLPAVPPIMCQLADALGVPIIEIGPSVNLNQIVHRIIEMIVSHRNDILSRLLLTVASYESTFSESESWRKTLATVKEETGINVAMTFDQGFRMPAPNVDIASQSFDKRMPWRPDHHGDSTTRLLDKRHTRGLQQLVLDPTDTYRQVHLILYQTDGTRLRPEDWNPLLVFLSVLAKRWLRYFWMQRKELVASFQEFLEDGNPEFLSHTSLICANGCQWVVSSPQSDPDRSWAQLEIARMKLRLKGLTFFGSRRVYFLRDDTEYAIPTSLISTLDDGSQFGFGVPFYTWDQAKPVLDRTRNTVMLNQFQHGLIDCTRLSLESVLAQIDGAVQKAFFEDVLSPLLEHDQRHQSGLLQTLGTFLEMGTIKATASQLYLHYNTVSYRLSQIEHLLQRSLNKHPDRLQIELAYSLMKFQ